MTAPCGAGYRADNKARLARDGTCASAPAASNAS
eukprot:CAMPEP_0198577094 /NCGR_PEP_ID=MMETSP1462-20131121/118459_1 /TAXON_ID=1333877 /ORGANISM="Brandtodinium nutriculum, Strain RCC3387" /LENGTH=33 /DNA_ID= /DNA_START= /DNA_END= /DNA_ORIENTATION=